MSPTPVCHFDRLQNNYVSWQPSHNLPSEIQENHAQHHGTGEQRGYFHDGRGKKIQNSVKFHCSCFAANPRDKRKPRKFEKWFIHIVPVE